ncbi:MAG: nitrous oxide reductase accessory protein NosL [Flavobacteriaceae bacterium]|nr:nitrous oxide reductase accessory protein NosL [Flavobacteriaceae bacterium]
MKKIILIVFSMVFFASCKIKPKEINFGQDACYFCKMTIVDKPFSSEIVNSKGKVYVYDAIECMIKSLEVENLDAKLYLVYDYENTTEFMDATKSHFIISDKIKSPMGENLAAFQSKATAEKFVKNNGGILLNWTEINARFKLNEK